MTEEQQQRVLDFIAGSDEPAVQPIPLDPAFEAKLVQAALRARTSRPGAAREPVPEPEQGKILPLPSRSPRRPERRRWWWAGAASVAAAAAVVCVVLFSGGERLGAYDPRVGVIENKLGGSDALPVVREVSLGPDAAGLAIDLQPHEAVTEPVEARAYLHQGDRVTAWSLTLSCGGQGRCRGRGELPALGAEPAEVVLVVGRTGRLPDEAEVTRLLRSGDEPSDRHWHLFRIKLRRTDAGSPASGGAPPP